MNANEGLWDDPGVVGDSERRDNSCNLINTKVPAIIGGQAVRGKGFLKTVLEEKELDLVVWRMFILHNSSGV